MCWFRGRPLGGRCLGRVINSFLPLGGFFERDDSGNNSGPSEGPSGQYLGLFVLVPGQEFAEHYGFGVLTGEPAVRDDPNQDPAGLEVGKSLNSVHGLNSFVIWGIHQNPVELVFRLPFQEIGLKDWP